MKAPAFLTRPIFICGHRRSGTTLLLTLLENHPNLLVYPAESGFFYAVYPPYFSDRHTVAGRIRQTASFCVNNLESDLAQLPEEARRRVKLSPRALRSDFRRLAAQTAGAPGDLLRSLMLAYWRAYRHPADPCAWVEKTTSSEIYAADALRWFPQARFIHLLRDPRDTWASMKSGWDIRFKYHNDSPARLMHSLIERGRFGFELADRNQRRFGGDVYTVVRYEDLLADPPGVLAELCRFIGVPFAREVFQPTVCGQPWGGNNYEATRFDGLSSRNAGRWPDRITPEEAALIEYHFGEFMERHGYPQRYTLAQQTDAAVSHYKWYNYAQTYSFSSTETVRVQPVAHKTSPKRARAR